MLERIAIIAILSLSPALAAAQPALERVEFAGFLEGDVIRDQYMFRGLRLAPDAAGGPFYDDAGGFFFLLDSPPGLLSLSPLVAGTGPGQVPGSVGTYAFDFVDPANPFVPSFTGKVEVVVALVDKGETILTAWDGSGNVLDRQVLTRTSFLFGTWRMSVAAPGIQRVTLETPSIQPTLGALVDTLVYERPPVLPARSVDIDIAPGSRRNQIRLDGRGYVIVAILSSAGFDPSGIDPGRVLFQKAGPISAMVQDRNRDRVGDLVLTFALSDLQGLDRTSTEAHLTAVDVDGTPLAGSDHVEVIERRRGPMTISGTLY